MFIVPPTQKQQHKIKPVTPIAPDSIDLVEVLKPQPGKQADFFDCTADLIIFGGGAGSGKSICLLAKAAKHIETPGYFAAIFRQHRPEITASGGLWSMSKSIYKDIPGSEYREGNQLDWRFASGSAIAFNHADKLSEKFVGAAAAFIGVDEIQVWDEEDFWFLMSRNRTDCGVKPQLVATCNPDADSFVADLVSWYCDGEGYPIPERSGVVRYFYRVEKTLYWANTEDELKEQFPELAAIAPPKSFTFISATVYDNPEFIKKNPEYLASLLALPRVEMERLLKGNWRLTDKKESLFSADAIAKCAVGQWSEPDIYRRYLMGIDPNFGAIGNDYYVAQVWDVTELPVKLVHEYRDNLHGSEAHHAEMMRLVQLFSPAITSIESNGGGLASAERLQRSNPSARIEVVTTGHLSKIVNTDRLAQIVEQGECQFPADWAGVREMSKFSCRDRQALSGNDDSVMAAAIAFVWMEEAIGIARISYESEGEVDDSLEEALGLIYY